MAFIGDKGIGLKGWLSGTRPQAKPQQAKAEPIALDQHRIAVLPFSNMSTDPKDEYFTDGMTEELISALSKIPELRVISRTSVMQYKDQLKPVADIGRELNVGTLLEGSVRKAGTRIRISVQLIDTTTDDHLWVENYDRNLDDIFAIQSDVASKVAGSLFAEIFASAQRRDTSDIEAYTMYMKAMQLYHEGTKPSLKEAVGLFEQAVLRDQRFVRAHAGLAHTLVQASSLGYEDYMTAVTKAELAARKALEIGPDWAEAHAAMSDVHNAFDRYQEAVSEAEKAIDINQNLSEAYTSLGVLYAVLGKIGLALENFGRAYELDPLSHRAGSLVAHWLMLAGKHGEAFSALERVRELNPRNPEIYVSLAECYILRKDFATAQEMLVAGLRINPAEPWLQINQGVLFAITGRRKEAEEQLRLLSSEESESVRLFGQLFICAALGNLDEAFKALMRMADTHSWPAELKIDPVFEKMWRDPRFAEFCKKVGVPS